MNGDMRGHTLFDGGLIGLSMLATPGWMDWTSGLIGLALGAAMFVLLVLRCIHVYQHIRRDRDKS